MARGGYLMQLGTVPYGEAWDLQRALAGAVSQGAIPDTVLFLEHPPVVTLGRRTEDTELHIPDGAEVEIVETNRGGKSTFHGPGQLVCYPILDLKRHGRDVKEYVRMLEQALIRTVAPFGLEAECIDGLTGVWLTPPPRKLASIGVHVSRWVTTHGYALNVDLDPAPFTDWITACGLDDATFTTVAREAGRPVTVDEVRAHAVAALEEVFGLELEPLQVEDGGYWLPMLRMSGGARSATKRTANASTDTAARRLARQPPTSATSRAGMAPAAQTNSPAQCVVLPPWTTNQASNAGAASATTLSSAATHLRGSLTGSSSPVCQSEVMVRRQPYGRLEAQARDRVSRSSGPVGAGRRARCRGSCSQSG